MKEKISSIKRMGKLPIFCLVLFLTVFVFAGASPVTAFGITAISTIESNDMAVIVDTGYPQAVSYMLKADSSEILGCGQFDYGIYKISINDTDYTPTVVFNKAAANKAQYTVTVNNVDLDGSGPLQPRTVTITYEFTVEGTELVKKITQITGDEASAPFRVFLKYPILSVTVDMPGAGLACSYSSEGGTDYRIGLLSEISPFNLNGFLYSFVWNNSAVGSVYTPSSFDRPYAVKLEYVDNKKVARTYDGVYHHRLADGHRPKYESSLNNFTDELYESKIHINKDSNSNGKVDWQDGALWIKSQIPQMPAQLREFFNGGGWNQTLGAFPGRVGKVSYNKGFTDTNTTLDQLVELQRQVYNMTDGISKQSYEYVGWNGRGHDYGWPSINELYYNPALGTDALMAAARVNMQTYGGDLSFHVNMTDMTTNSNAYMRGSQASPYGNRDISTGVLQYDASIFGWDAYKINHYTDVKNGYPFNRQNAFVDRFWAPFIIYQDVMLDYPYNTYGNAEERYAKKREIDHWKVLGTYAATEYYDAEKRKNGQFLFKNYARPSLIDNFINAGMTVFENTNYYVTQPKDYIWGSIYSDNERTGNINLGVEKNFGAVGLTKMTFLYSLLNGFLAEHGLQEYVDESSRYYTRWGNNIVCEIDKTTNKIKVTDGDVTIADGEDRFIPAIDGTNRIFAYSVKGSANTWKLPLDWRNQSTLNLYELTSSGRNFVNTVNVVNGSVTFTMAPLHAYVLTPSSEVKSAVNRLNLSLLATVTASTNTDTDYDYTRNMFYGVEYRYITKDSAPNNDWTSVLKDMTPNMIDAQGTIRYEAPVVGGFTADGTQSTYWMPNYESERGVVDMADGSAWLEYNLGKNAQVNKFVIKEAGVDGDKVTSFEIQYNSCGSWGVLYEGTSIPTDEINTYSVLTDKIRLVIKGAQSNKPKISELEIYGPKVYTNDYNDNNISNLQIVNNSNAAISATNGEVRLTGTSGDAFVVDNSSISTRDGIYTFSMKPGSDARSGALIRYVSSDTYTWIGFESNGLMKIRVANPNVSPWAEMSLMRSPLSPNDWHTVKIVYSGNDIRITVDGQDFYTGPLPGAQPALAGKTGFMCWSVADCRFDDVQQKDDPTIQTYTDDYYHNNISNLQIANNSNASISTTNGEVHLTSTGGGTYVVDNNSISTRDGIYTFNMKPGANARCGALIRYVSNDTHTWIGFESSGLMRIRVVNPNVSPWAEISFMRSPLSPNDWHTVKIVYCGNDISVTVDGQDFYTGPLPGAQPALTGKTGFMCWSVADCRFDAAQQKDDPTIQVYADDYNDNNISNLQIVNNSNAVLSASNGEVHLTGTSGDIFVVDNNSISTRDGIYTMKVKPGANARCGALIRYVSNDTYTWIGFESDGHLRIREAINGTWSEIYFMQTQLSPNDWHVVNIVYYGRNISVTVDGQDFYTGPLPGIKPIFTGKTGFVGWSVSDCRFDDVRQER